MPLVLNVAFVENSQANTTVWRDAALQQIGNALSQYVEFTPYDITYHGTYSGQAAAPAQTIAVWETDAETGAEYWKISYDDIDRFIKWDQTERRWFFTEAMPDGHDWMFYTNVVFTTDEALRMPWQIPLSSWRKKPESEDVEGLTVPDSDVPWLASIRNSEFEMFIEIPNSVTPLKSIITGRLQRSK